VAVDWQLHQHTTAITSNFAKRKRPLVALLKEGAEFLELQEVAIALAAL